MRELRGGAGSRLRRAAAGAVWGMAVCAVVCGQAPWAAAAAPEAAEAPQAPAALPLRNDHPLYLAFFAPVIPDRAHVAVPERLHWQLTYVNSNNIIEQDNFTRTDLIVVDAEIQRVELGLKYAVNDRLEFGVTLPYLVMGGGYMDSFIDVAEEGLGFTVPGSRETTGHNDFAYFFRANNTTLINETETIDGLADIPLQVKYRLRNTTETWLPVVSVRGVVKLPTATAPLLGNDRVDAGVGVLAEQPLGRRVVLWGNADLTTAHTTEALKSLDVKGTMLSGTLGLDWRLTPNSVVTLQTMLATNPYPEFHQDMTAFNGVPGGLGLGWTYRLTRRVGFQFMVAENYADPTWPDFSWAAALTGEF